MQHKNVVPYNSYAIAIELKKILGKKIIFVDSINKPHISGKYFLDINNELMSNEIGFSFDYNKNNYLKLNIGSNLDNKTVKEKLSVLSDFYLILSQKFGEPTLFYITEENNILSMQWLFNKKYKKIKELEDSDCIDELILLDDLNEVIVDKFKKSVGLPYPLVHLLFEDNKYNLNLRKYK